MFRQVIVPRWVMWTLTLQAFAFISLICLAVFVGLSLMPNYGEQPFTDAQRAYLDDMRPTGVYLTSSTFRYCDGGVFWYVTPRTDLGTRNESCVSGMPKR